ncbi:MAG TPA: PAS domain S-box protein [Bryobacteraceae bacterium]|nr:PAS domain S-box protein [Bryobacteraceae bacterium]
MQTQSDLESVLATDELNRRSARLPNHEAETQAFVALAQSMADSPHMFLQKLAESALQLCGAHSALISLLSDDTKRFHWPAIAGKWAKHIGGGTPLDHGPSGTVLDRDSPVLFSHPERYFTYLLSVQPEIAEALLVPFYVQGKAVGTIWIIAHDESRLFDAEDLRVMTSLGKFAGAAYQTLKSIESAAADQLELQKANSSLRTLQNDLIDFLENAAIGMHWVGPDGTILWANRAELEMLGFTQEEYVGREIGEFHADQERIEDILRRLKAGEVLKDYEAQLKCKDGSLRTVLISSNALSENGKFIHTRCFSRDITEQKLVQEKLAESELRMRKLIEALPVAVYTTDTEGRLTMFNQAAVDLSGWTPELGADFWYAFWQFYRPDGTLLPVDEYPMALTLREGRPIGGYELRAKRADGKSLILIPYPTPLRDSSGKLIGAVNLIVDVTERKKGDEAIRRLAAIIESSEDAIIAKNLDGLITDWNAGAERIFGYTIEEVIGQPVTILIPPDRVDEEPNIIARVRRGERIEHYETVRRRKDGALLDISLSVSPIFDQHGRIVGASKIARDISSQVLVRSKIAESEKRLRFMADSMPQKIFTANASGEMDYFNRQWTDFAGLPIEELKARDWTDFIHPVDVEETIRLWRRSIETGEDFQFVHRFRSSDGLYRWHLSRAHAMRDDAGKVLIWIGSNTDIHEEKQTQEELRRLNDDLNQFAFAASHDIQEPLRMITSYSQLLLRRSHGVLGEEASQYVEYITEGAARMRDLLGDLLSFTRLGADEQESPESVELNGIFRMAFQNLETSIAESGAIVTCETLPTIHGQKAHFVQLFQNLIGNAIKYRGESAPRIQISCEKRNMEWRFAIADNGIGIDSQYFATIFVAFKRLHGKAIPGTGIGLAICKRVVERYGGRIWVESQPNLGATFYFTLPAVFCGI